MRSFKTHLGRAISIRIGISVSFRPIARPFAPRRQDSTAARILWSSAALKI